MSEETAVAALSNLYSGFANNGAHASGNSSELSAIDGLEVDGAVTGQLTQKSSSYPSDDNEIRNEDVDSQETEEEDIRHVRTQSGQDYESEAMDDSSIDESEKADETEDSNDDTLDENPESIKHRLVETEITNSRKTKRKEPEYFDPELYGLRRSVCFEGYYRNVLSLMCLFLRRIDRIRLPIDLWKYVIHIY